MIVSEKYGYCYVSCPRTGSSTTSGILLNHFDGHFIGDWTGAHLRVVPSKFGSLFLFSGVRNPYRRMVSFWWNDTFKKHRKKRDSKGQPFRFIENHYYGMNFCRWLEYVRSSKRRDSPIRSVICSQSEFFGDLNLDCVVHLENFIEEFSKLHFVGDVPDFDIIGRAGTSRWSHGRSYGDYLDHYKDPKVLSLVNDICRDDFKRFGYEMRTSLGDGQKPKKDS